MDWKDIRLTKDVTDEIENQRIELCKSCEKFTSLIKACKECGCFMPVKVRYSFFNCPLKKW
jgi:hypothetical protein